MPFADVEALIEGCAQAMAIGVTSQTGVQLLGVHVLAGLKEASKTAQPPEVETVLDELTDEDADVVESVLKTGELSSTAPTTTLRSLAQRTLRHLQAHEIVDAD